MSRAGVILFCPVFPPHHVRPGLIIYDTLNNDPPRFATVRFRQSRLRNTHRAPIPDQIAGRFDQQRSLSDALLFKRGRLQCTVKALLDASQPLNCEHL